MVFITWDDSYSVHVESIDKQHQKMMSMINDLHNALLEGETVETIVDVLNRLKIYTEEHFKFEEDIFDKYDYPEGPDHKKRHHELVDRVNNFHNRLTSDHEKVGDELLEFLLFWLGNHIKTVDRQYTAFMLEKGIR